MILLSIGFILLGGALGGVINAIMSDNGFIRPREETVDNVSIIRPGFAGNILLGSISAFVSWGLYGSFGSAIIYGNASGVGAQDVSVTISAMAGAILIGVGGARWLTNEVDKTLLKTAAITAAAARPSPEGSQSITVATPAQAFNIAKKMYEGSI
ncbi:MAG: hypothetical protein HPY61_14820 [Methanotrichaceae archaeon]|nr:hypothetical protein [Methanotrichaceae archaeon]